MKKTSSPSPPTAGQLFRDSSFHRRAFIGLIWEQNGGQERTDRRDWTLAEGPKCVCRIDSWQQQQKKKRCIVVRGGETVERVRFDANLSDVLSSSDASPQRSVLAPLYLCCTQRSAGGVTMDRTVLNFPPHSGINRLWGSPWPSIRFEQHATSFRTDCSAIASV